MNIVRPTHYFSDDFLLDTSLSFEARSLFMLISSLASSDDSLYAPSTAILVAATGWDEESVTSYAAELVAARIVQEIPGEERRYVLLPHKALPLSVGSPSASSALNRDILTDEERAALLGTMQ